METCMIDLLDGFTDVKSALRRLEFEIAVAHADGVPYAKIRHGNYPEGSLCALRRQTRRMLRAFKKEGRIRVTVPGEKFGRNDVSTLYLIDRYPLAEMDADLDAKNADITVILL